MTQEESDRHWMARALGWARLAADRGEVPIGAIVVREAAVLGGAHDGKELFKDPSAHAEMLALREAALRQGDWRLDGATLYVTLEPCVMCAGAMIHSRIARVVFGAKNPRWGAIATEDMHILANDRFNHRVDVTAGVLEDACAALLRETFRAYRKKNEPEARGA